MNLSDGGESKSSSGCKCGLTDACWPSPSTWSRLNATVSGRLILNTPIAISCYSGPQKNAVQCAAVERDWPSAYYQEQQAIGYSYPVENTCPPVNISAGQTSGSCSIGNLPRYTINATTPGDVAAGIAFCKKNNIRLVIHNTGHDALGRSEGYGSLAIWLHYLRTGLVYERAFVTSHNCTKTNWTGPAIKIGGGYSWNDVYPLAESNNVVVVGAGTPSVGCLGGWMQGGGHGYASRQFGLGADQVLEASVILANGSTVTASPCDNSDLYFAIRGGGGGTYGVVISTTVKAWPVNPVVVQNLAMGALTSNVTALFQAAATIWSAFPDLDDFGFSGYGQMAVNFIAPLFATFKSGYVHGISAQSRTLAQAQAAFAPTLQKLQQYNGSDLYISVSYSTYSDYWSFYNNLTGIEPPIGFPSIAGGRLFDRTALAGNTSGLASMLAVIAGEPGQYVLSNFELVSGGQVFADASDHYSSVNPAWRKSYLNNLLSINLVHQANNGGIHAARDAMTNTLIPAMTKQAPNTGAYMNEVGHCPSCGDLHFADTNMSGRLIDMTQITRKNFYGSHYRRLLQVKLKYDPSGIFYCPTCVGSEQWTTLPNGNLCRTPAPAF